MRRSRWLTWVVAVVLGIAALLLTSCGAPASRVAHPDARPVSPVKEEPTMTLTLTSPAFVSAESAGSASAQAGSSSIPPRFAMRAVPGGHNISIPYVWRDAPASTASFALALIDTAPVAHDWVHWLVVGIPASTTALGEAASGGAAMPSGAVELRNSFGATGYGGPQPPIGTGQHPYVATIFALDVRELGVPASASLADVERAMRGHVLASATCTGHFGR